MTSNLGSDLIQERFGELDYGHMKDLVLGVVSQNFRPEFINRIDEVVVFHPLGEKHIASIAQIQLQRLYKRLEERGYEVQMSDDALKLLSVVNPFYGCTPLNNPPTSRPKTPEHQILSGEGSGKLYVKNHTQSGWGRSKQKPKGGAGGGLFLKKGENGGGGGDLPGKL